jgi:hypothetical protein
VPATIVLSLRFGFATEFSQLNRPSRGKSPSLPDSLTESEAHHANHSNSQRTEPALLPPVDIGLKLASADALDAIRQTSRAVRRTGAAYALVNVPEHSFRWSGRDGPFRYHDYIAALKRLADDEGFAFIDVTAGATDQFSRDEDYSDYHHMSPEGAGRFKGGQAVIRRADFVPDQAQQYGQGFGGIHVIVHD